jgi:hypothetical protein
MVYGNDALIVQICHSRVAGEFSVHHAESAFASRFRVFCLAAYQHYE